MNNIITEQNFAVSGLIDPDTSNIELGKLIGADYILTGSLVNYDVEEGYLEDMVLKQKLLF